MTSTGFCCEKSSPTAWNKPDPVPLAVLPRLNTAPAAPADSNAGSGCGQHVGCASPGRPEADKRRRRQASLTRLRLGSALPDRTPCPSRMSTLEQNVFPFNPWDPHLFLLPLQLLQSATHLQPKTASQLVKLSAITGNSQGHYGRDVWSFYFGCFSQAHCIGA
ncbi:uncharacterized protein [Triticum aestivum]|uniref:uncharacterized protein n=1 Tax=Triticum aestivum TaxID=4565 RepID=UPI0008458CDE|nr:uncharacterized protein LOC109737879 [Aegilops tauschii subsp. strangulata]XP_044401944.1 uncharacterized protein LOC123125537 [Triticum aestivum]